ncbi:TetR/AcrR family transcriptional regulator [Microbacterium jejuense]|uniref:TetR/AcrR family transcriptional regulator n=1 Tax=Microbacterium jejuense TaxID=1263637 RepID=A0ABS7HJW9_9MICO|nr:helix-turn-helix domain-containing protein [Microbacterium jejuense]MBW9092576.1 TetR/AcrR family transcriptional regulator [Microbacterium jejuense]
MTRTKTQSDQQVLDVALQIVQESGVRGLTFSAVAERCGLSAPTLVQRFSNKATLTRRTLLHAWDQLEAQTRELAETTPLTPAGAVELLIGLSQDFGDADSYADGLLLLREDVRDPALRARGVAWEEQLVAALDARLPPGTTGAGYALAAFWQGAVLWGAYRTDRPLPAYLDEKLRAFVDLLVSPNK